MVEDDLDLARVIIITTIFERQGIDAFHAATGREAIEMNQQITPDLLILDIGLPEGDGFSVVDWMRKYDQLRHAPL